MLRITLILAVFILLQSCSDTIGDRQAVTDSIYEAYLENETLRKEAKNANDREGMQRSWTLNTAMLAEEVADSLRFALLQQRMNISRQLFPLDTTIAIAHTYEAMAIDKKDSSKLADAWFRLAFYYDKSAEPVRSRNYHYKTIQLAADLKDTLLFARSSINLANYLNDIEDYAEAQQIATDALGMDPPDDQKLKLFTILATAAGEQGNYTDKLYWLEKAIAVTDERPVKNFSDYLQRAVPQNNKAMGYYGLGETEKALHLLEELARDTIWNQQIAAKNKKAITEYARILFNLAKTKYRLGIPDPKALTERSEALLRSIDNKEELSHLYAQMAGYYKERDISKARTLALQALEYARETQQTKNRMTALSILTEITPQPKAYAMEFQTLSDSINKHLIQARDAFARYKYDIDRTRSVNKQLEAETKLQKLEIRDSRIRSIFLAITVIILLGAGSLGYRLTRTRARLKQAKEVQKTEAAIAKRIHDELANDLYNTMTFAELNPLNDARNKDHLLNNLEDIYKRTRNISRENAGLPTGSDFGKAVSSLINHYRSEKTNILVRGLNEVKWEKLEDFRQQTLYRVLQELLVNMRKHSEATLVMITFSQQGKKLDIGYKDNGKGLPEDHIPGGGGIQNIESRLKQTGGRFKLESAKGKGVRVAVVYE